MTDETPATPADDAPAAAPAVAGADVPGVLDTADAGGKPLVPDAPADEPEPAPQEAAPELVDGVGVTTVDGDVLAVDHRGGAPIHMDSDGTTIEFTSAEPIKPARLREFINRKEVWNALGRQHTAATS